MGRLSDALNAGLRRAQKDQYRTGRYTGNARVQQRRDEIDDQISDIIKSYYAFLDQYNLEVRKKDILERAGKIVIKTLKQKAEAIRVTGNLKKSAGWIKTKSKTSVLAGFNYWKNGRHAHLVEFGFIAKNGQYVPGYNLVRNTYEETKGPVLQQLIAEFKKKTDEIARQQAR